MFDPGDTDNLLAADYTGSLMKVVAPGEFELQFIPAALIKHPFKYWIKYQEAGVSGETLFPANAVGDNAVIRYNSKPTAVASSVEAIATPASTTTQSSLQNEEDYCP